MLKVSRQKTVARIALLSNTFLNTQEPGTPDNAMGLSTHHNAENNKYGTLPLQRHLTVAHAHLPNGKILKTGFGCIEELQFTSPFIQCGGDCVSMGVTLRRAALLGRHMTVCQETVLRESQSDQHILRCLASIWQLDGHSDHNVFCFTEGETLTRVFLSCS